MEYVQTKSEDYGISDMTTQETKVLVVEDDNHLLSGIREILELEDYSVLTAKNGRDALAVLQSDPDNPPDVIVSDIMMPQMDGFEFLEEVRKEDRWVTVPFIFLTAKGERTDQFKGRTLGADVYLTKPFDAEDLLVAVGAALKRHRNIARVKNREREIAISDQKKKILTILNHEFRTPLTLVVAYADMLKDFNPQNMDGMSADEIMTYLRGVNSGADRLRRLIENFITIVELDSGEAQKTYEWRKRPVEDIGIIVYDAVRQVDFPSTRPRNFKIDVPQGLPAVTCDVQFLTIAIRELLDNAAKFSSDGDTITLRARDAGEMLEISIEDPGRGVSLEEQPHIWSQFYQIDREQFEDQGAGSGLAIVDGIIKMHDGEREMQSTPDVGSTFTIRIPYTPPATS